MRRKTLSAIAGLLGLGAVTTGFVREAITEAEVRAALEHYLLGHSTGDGAHFSQVFHPESRLTFIRNGAYTTRTSADYIAGAAGKPAADEAQRKRRIVSVDVAGDAAMAKIELDYPSTFFTDYFTLLKINGKWMIMNKTFHARPK